MSLASPPTSTTPVYPFGTGILVPRTVRPRNVAIKGPSSGVVSGVIAELVLDSARFEVSVAVESWLVPSWLPPATSAGGFPWMGDGFGRKYVDTGAVPVYFMLNGMRFGAHSASDSFSGTTSWTDMIEVGRVTQSDA